MSRRSRRDHVALWGHDPEHVAALARDRENRRHLPGLPLARRGGADGRPCRARETPRSCWASCRRRRCAAVARLARPFLREGAAFVVCAKGIERGSHKFMSEVIAEEAPQVEVAVLSGPSFAADVCKGLPTAVTLASSARRLARRLAEQLSTKILSAVSLDRFARRRDWRRGQERAGDRLRHGGGAGARRQRASGA